MTIGSKDVQHYDYKPRWISRMRAAYMNGSRKPLNSVRR